MAGSSVSPIIEQYGYQLDKSLSINLTKALANVYGYGFEKAVEEAAVFDSPVLHGPDPLKLLETAQRLIDPIKDYNKALAEKIGERIEGMIEEGLAPGEIARDLRQSIPEMLRNEQITIQRPGKQAVSFTAKQYADAVAGNVTYQIRNDAYVDGLEAGGVADGWDWVATEDERMCDECGEKDGKTFEFSEPRPPEASHFGCRCRPKAHIKKGLHERAEEIRKKNASDTEYDMKMPKIKDLEKDKPIDTFGMSNSQRDKISARIVRDLDKAKYPIEASDVKTDLARFSSEISNELKISDTETLMKKNLKLGLKGSENLDDDQAVQIYKSLTKNSKLIDLGDIGIDKIEIKEMQDNAMAGVLSKKFGQSKEAFYVNSKWVKDPMQVKADLAISEKYGYHPKGCNTIESVIDHEMGHLLDAEYGVSKTKQIKNLKNGLTSTEIKKGLSEYATRSESEFIAEAWTEFLNNKEPRPIAKYVGSLIVKLAMEA